MKKITTNQLFQSTLILIFLLVATASFGQRVSLQASGGAAGSPPIKIAPDAPTMLSIEVFNPYHLGVSQVWISTTFINANINTSKPTYSPLNPNESLYIDIEIPKNQPYGLYLLEVHYVHPTAGNMTKHIRFKVEANEAIREPLQFHIPGGEN